MAANLVEYLASPLTEADLKRFDRKLGDPRGTPPVAPRWQNRRVRLTAKGDSIAMLSMALHVEAGS